MKHILIFYERCKGAVIIIDELSYLVHTVFLETLTVVVGKINCWNICSDGRG